MERWTVLREFNWRIKEAFDARGIAVPAATRPLVLSEETARLLTLRPAASRLNPTPAAYRGPARR